MYDTYVLLYLGFRIISTFECLLLLTTFKPFLTISWIASTLLIYYIGTRTRYGHCSLQIAAVDVSVFQWNQSLIRVEPSVSIEC